MATDLIVQRVNREIAEQFSDKSVVATLISTTFKGMSESTMKRAIMEGMIRGFGFKDFLNKDVYAIAYGDSYSLVTSIDYMRKIASQNGQTGKDEPVFEDDANGKPKTCSMTVYRNGNPFSAKVYFDEYYSGCMENGKVKIVNGIPKKPTQWDTRPRTMIAKVAEMHALRMAFPEELSKAYVEEEQRQTFVKDEPTINREAIRNALKTKETNESIVDYWHTLSPSEQSDKEVVNIFRERKLEIQNYAKAKDAEVSEDTSDGATE